MRIKDKKRLIGCKKIYGRVVGIGPIFIHSGRSTPRRLFYYYVKEKDGFVYRKLKPYARYKMERKLKKILPSRIHVHHIDENSLNDCYKNLAVVSLEKHLRLTHKGKIISKELAKRMGEPNIGKKRSKETRLKISKALTGRKFSSSHIASIKKRWYKFRMKKNIELMKKYGVS